MERASKPKHRRIFDALMRDIVDGRYQPGQKFPSEAALVKRFGASRITVGRAVRDLRQNGLIDRVPGSGTWVRGSGRTVDGSLMFGLLIPNLGETEIFEPICQAIAQSPDAAGHALLWGQATAGEEPVLALCRQYVRRSVSGVFFAPLEMAGGADAINRRALKELTQAGIPVVLLDRRPELPAFAHRYDLIGIDNRRAGFLAGEHLARAGALRIGFVSIEHQAATVALRRAGFHDALSAHGLTSEGELTFDSRTDEGVAARWKAGRFDGFVCANDRVAGRLMHFLLARGIRIPADVRIVGIDDVNYASLLPVPLTTIHQPCRDIGEAALRVMLERIGRPAMSARDVLLECSLVVRQSCGAASTGHELER